MKLVTPAYVKKGFFFLTFKITFCPQIQRISSSMCLIQIWTLKWQSKLALLKFIFVVKCQIVFFSILNNLAMN